MARRSKKLQRARGEQYAENTRRSMAYQGRDRHGSHNRQQTRRMFRRK